MSCAIYNGGYCGGSVHYCVLRFVSHGEQQERYEEFRKQGLGYAEAGKAARLSFCEAYIEQEDVDKAPIGEMT